MSEWEELYLSDIGTLARGKSKHRPRWADHLYGGFYPFIQTGEISAANKYISTYRQTYSEAGLAQSKLWEKGTLCITIAANIAEIAILDFPACFPDSVLGFIPNPEKADLDFVFYTLTFLKEKIQNLAIGSVQENINLGTFKNIKFLFPPIEEQKQIATVLSHLDLKIENLRKQNETLERIAQTLFKHWFVDFEFPNDEGKPYKSSGGEMVRSELGEIPVGWRVVKMEEIADRISMGPFGSRITIDNFVDSGVPVIRGGNLVNGFNEAGFVYLTEEKADDLKSSNAFSEDIIFTHRGTLGQVGFIPTHSQYPRYVVSQSQMLLGINKKIASPRFIYRFFCSQVGLNAILANTNTTGVPSIGRPTTTLKSIQTTLPEGKVMRQFDSLMKSIDFKKDANNKQIQTLVQSRDALLPKIMTGQISVI
jgi:type I restriction enzyme, S subunit